MPNADADGLAELYFGKRSDARLLLVSKSGGMNCAPAA